VLQRSRARALAALVSLTDVDPNDASGILELQLQVRLYRDLIEEVRAIRADGDDAAQQLDQEQREAVERDLMPDQETPDVT
jgi:uncharacterized protein YPO0396